MAPKFSVRPAGPGDLDALERLERAGFRPEDAFSRAQLRRLLAGNAAAFLAESTQGAKRPVGSAVVLWRRGSPSARLYTIAADPAFQGKGAGSLLLEACERAAAEKGCAQMRLEVRQSNRRAIAFYERRGYRTVETLPGYYPGGEAGLRMAKDLGPSSSAEAAAPARRSAAARGGPKAGASSGKPGAPAGAGGDGPRLDLPYYAQTLGFTCGPACLMMAMRHFDPKLRLDRTLELVLWKEATTVFMTAGLGGCEPFGLAVAAGRRGYRAEVLVPGRGVPFLGSVRTEDKKEVVRLVHRQMKAEAESLGTAVRYRGFGSADIARALRGGAVPIVLVSAHRLHGFRVPHWVVVTGFDGRNIYLHDPYERHYRPHPRRARHLRVSAGEFERMTRWGKDSLRSAVLIRPAPRARKNKPE